MDKTINIALVDDEADVFTLFKMHFRKEIREDKYRFFFFENGEKCYEFIEENEMHIRILLILSDVNMPIMDGYTLLSLVHDKYSHIKVFMITAYDTQEMKLKVKTLGADELLAKPLDFTILKKKIQNILLQIG